MIDKQLNWGLEYLFNEQGEKKTHNGTIIALEEYSETVKVAFEATVKEHNAAILKMTEA
jgi:hypothetical protein